MAMTIPAHGIRLLVRDSDPDTAEVIAALLHTRGDHHYTVDRVAPSAAGLAPEPQQDQLVLLGIDTTAQTPGAAAASVRRVTVDGTVVLALLRGPWSPGFEAGLVAEGIVDFCWREELSPALLTSLLRHAWARGSEREQLEREFTQAQRMESVGRLAGGIAHDFNNILMAIVGFGTLVAEELAGSPSGERNAREILNAAGRASALTRQLLAFGRRQMLRATRLNLNEAVAGIAVMLQQVIGEDIDLQVRYSADLPLILADQGQLESSVLNLVLNARDAMPGGGRLTIETDTIHLDQAYCDAHLGARPGHFVRLAVSDTGVGIPHHLQPRIFEPFFTTKDVGKGTGLGLATVYGTIKQSGGYIWVYSEPGVGTTFKIYLPVDTSEGAPALPPPAPVEEPASGSETILLVEDADMVRQLAREIIGGAGYHVIEAGNAEQALAAAAQHDGPIDLLLTDVIMPGATGVELAARLRSVRENVNVLYMSGYTDNAVVRQGLLDEETAFLQKPFTPQDLLRKVREVLQVRA